MFFPSFKRRLLACCIVFRQRTFHFNNGSHKPTCASRYLLELIRNLSAGNKQKVGIIAALLHNPQLIILDEPFNFLDPSSQLAIKYILDDYNKQTGATILISSHSLSNTLDICTRVILLEYGEVIKDMKKDEEDVTAVLKQYFESSLHHEQ